MLGLNGAVPWEAWRIKTLREIQTMEAYEFQREVQELLKHSAQAICDVFHFRICGNKTFALLGHECWLTRAEQPTMIKKRPASLKQNLLG